MPKGWASEKRECKLLQPGSEPQIVIKVEQDEDIIEEEVTETDTKIMPCVDDSSGITQTQTQYRSTAASTISAMKRHREPYDGIGQMVSNKAELRGFLKNEQMMEQVQHEPTKVFYTFEEARSFIDEFEIKTYSKYNILSREKYFGQHGLEGLDRLALRWFLNQGVETPYFPFDGIPFIIRGHIRFFCQHGKDYCKIQKKKNRALSEQQGIERRDRKKPPVKIGCLAKVCVYHLIRFPTMRIPKFNDRGRKAMNAQIMAIFRQDPTSLPIESIFVMKEPLVEHHSGHLINCPEAAENEPVDRVVREKIRDLVQNGYRNVADIIRQLEIFVSDELQVPLDQRHRRRYNPSRKTVFNILYSTKRAMGLHLNKEDRPPPQQYKIIYEDGTCEIVEGAPENTYFIEETVEEEEASDTIQQIITLPSNEEQIVEVSTSQKHFLSQAVRPVDVNDQGYIIAAPEGGQEVVEVCTTQEEDEPSEGHLKEKCDAQVKDLKKLVGLVGDECLQEVTDSLAHVLNKISKKVPADEPPAPIKRSLSESAEAPSPKRAASFVVQESSQVIEDNTVVVPDQSNTVKIGGEIPEGEMIQVGDENIDIANALQMAGALDGSGEQTIYIYYSE